METITHEEIKHLINLMKKDWEAYRDINFLKAMCNHLIQEISMLEAKEMSNIPTNLEYNPTEKQKKKPKTK